MTGTTIPTRRSPLARICNAIEAWLLRHDVAWLDDLIQAYEADPHVDAVAIRALRDQRAAVMCRLALIQ